MKSKIIIFIVVLVALLAFQSKVIMPVLYDIAASDLFLEESGDEKNRTSSVNDMTTAAFNQCNNYIEKELLSEQNILFSDTPLNAFSLGNFQYVVNADIDVQPTDGASFTRRYACRIKYSYDEDSSGVSDPANWSIEGISGLDNI